MLNSIPANATMQTYFATPFCLECSAAYFNSQCTILKGKKNNKKKKRACKGDEMDEMAKLEKETCCAQASWLNKVYHESVH